MANQTPKWALVATWRRYRLFRTKAEAEARLKEWAAEREAEGLTVTGSMSRGSYTARVPTTREEGQVCGLLKLADHPLEWIGVISREVAHLRRLAEAGDDAYEALDERARALSALWREDAAL